MVSDCGTVFAKFETMKRILALAFFFSMVGATSVAQIYVYAGNAHYPTEMVLRFENNRMLPAASFSINDAYYTVVGNQIMEGPMGSAFDLLFTFREGKLYTGNGMFTSQIAYTLANGKIYKGDSVFELDVLYNVRNDVIYVGSQSFPTDAIYYIQGRYNPSQLFAILLSLQLIS
jgi:hypothetical protein